MDLKLKAKTVRIIDLYPYQLKRIGKVLRGPCVFHEDKGYPNFVIYPETNTFCCFRGCGAGDSITYWMKLKHCDFKTAIKELSKK